MLAPPLRHPPPVSYPLGPSPWLARWLWGVWLLGMAAAIICLWLLPYWVEGRMARGSVWPMLLACGISGLALRSFWRQQRPRTLHWDGQGWFLHADHGVLSVGPGHVRPVLDMQRALLLCYSLPGQRGAQWLWVDARASAYHWHLLRCALYSPPHRWRQHGNSPSQSAASACIPPS